MTNALVVHARDHAQDTSLFDSVRQVDEGGEWWSARDLMPLYGYNRWNNFSLCIERAKVACAQSAHSLTSNFTDTTKINASRHRIADIRLSRYAAYLVAMEGDSSKPQIAAAKTYFAVQTRRAEVLLDGLAEIDPDDPDREMLMMIRQANQIIELRRAARMSDVRHNATDTRVTELERRNLDLERRTTEAERELAVARADAEEAARQAQTNRLTAEAAQRKLLEMAERMDNVEGTTPLRDRTGLHTSKEAAQLLGFGQNNFFEWLRNQGIIYRDGQGHKIYQKFMDIAWGEARWVEWANGQGHSWVPMWTPKAIVEMQKRLNGHKPQAALF